MSRNDDKPIWVADCETDPFKYGDVPEPFIWGIFDGVNYWEFLGTGLYHTCTVDDIARVVDFLRDKEIILYAHNGGKFD